MTQRKLSAEEIATIPAVPRANTHGEQERHDGVVLTHRFAEAPGAVIPIRWHYVEAGPVDAPVLVLVHGHPFSWATWAPVIARLGASFRVIAPDLKGYGQSDKRPGDWRAAQGAEELLALLDAVGLERFSLVAADRGTTVSDHLAARHVSRVARYVRIGAPDAGSLEDTPDYEQQHREPLWAHTTLGDGPRYLASFLRPMLMREPALDEWAGIVAEFSHPQIGEAVPRWFQASSFAAERDARAVHLFPALCMPVLQITGAQSRRTVPAGAAVAVPNGRSEVVAGAGAYPVHDTPGRVAELIADFCTGDLAKPGEGVFGRADPTWRATPQKFDPASRIENHEGEIEMLGDTAVVHHFRDGPSVLGPIRWHYVEAGDPAHETLLLLHGHPESWHGWSHQIQALAHRFHIVAPDLKGYGQSDKRPGDYRHEFVAEELLAFLDTLGLDRFHIAAHDRGAVQADYIGGKHPERVLSYARMQQVLHLWIPMNSPQERIFRDPVTGPQLLSDPVAIFARQWGRFHMEPGADARLPRLRSEVGHDGFGDAVPRYFQSSSFLKELYDRTTRLCRNMRFPVLLLQADGDVGQPRWYYDDPARPGTEQFPDARLRWVKDAGHFYTINHPDQVTDALVRFLDDVQQPASKAA